MTTTSLRVQQVLSLALTAGVAACGATPNTQVIGTTPADLSTVCAGDWLAYLALPEPVDFLALRRVTNRFDGEGTREETFSLGEPCAGAGNRNACENTLDDTWPTPAGWGYCGEGCSDSGLVTTRGSDVSLYETRAQVAALFGEIDAPAEALFLPITVEYTPACGSLVETDDDQWRMTADILTGDCPWTEETHEIEVRRDGTIEVLQIVEVREDGACAGRRPDGLCPAPHHGPTAVARHIAHLAWLEGAAVVAFSHLASELAHHGAPTALIHRAEAAARDEVRHAEQMSAFAQEHGAPTAPVHVSAQPIRSLLSIALENAIEGCVRETYGAADAHFRAQHAATPRIRALFASIADDEARHAALSWDVAAWILPRLSAAEQAQVHAAMAAARRSLRAELAAGFDDAVQVTLGAPPAAAALAMAEVLEGLGV